MFPDLCQFVLTFKTFFYLWFQIEILPETVRQTVEIYLANVVCLVGTVSYWSLFFYTSIYGPSAKHVGRKLSLKLTVGTLNLVSKRYVVKVKLSKEKVNASKNLALSFFRNSPKFQTLKCRFSLWNSSPKKPKIWTSLLPFWTVLNSQAAFSWHHCIQEILFKWCLKSLLTTSLGYGCSGVVLICAKHDSIILKIKKWIIRWKKDLLTLRRMPNQLQVFRFWVIWNDLT